MLHSVRFFVLGTAFILAANFCVLTGLIADWGRWYSPSPAYRLQTDAFLRGKIAISDSPSDVLHDFAWAEGGVQQVWGLGIPIFRLPFEALARVMGQQAFPDRLVLLAALLLFYAIGINVILRPSEANSVSQWLTQLANHPFRVAAFVALAFFPSVTTFCMGAFNVYEEAVLAGYLAASGLFLALQSFIRSPCWPTYIALCTFAGLIPLVRATTGCYGLAATLVAAIVAGRSLGWGRALTGLLLFGAGGAIVFGSNLIRFGDGIEFGHQLNISGGDLTYMSRLGGPYDNEPFTSAALELLGSMFGVPRLNGFDCYADGVVMFQSPTVRWRHFYNFTFDTSHLLIVAILLGWTCCLLRRRKNGRSLLDAPLGAASVWFLISTFMLAAFYLRFHAISSRYIMDFAPAIAGLMCAGLLQLDVDRSLGRGRHGGVWVILVITALWYVSEIYVGSRESEPTPVLNQAEALFSMPRLGTSEATVPLAYTAPVDPGKQSQVEQFVLGWQPDGATEPLVLLYVSNLENLVLDVEPAVDWPLTDDDYRSIRAKVGLETLELESIRSTERGRRLVYAAPRRTRYKLGVHLLFLAMTHREEILRSKSNFLLKEVASRQASSLLD